MMNKTINQKLKMLFTSGFKTSFFIFVLLALFSSHLYAQTIKVSGNVKDESGFSLTGVSVLAKGTSVGTITDKDGNFKLTIPESAKVLQFSFIGMKQKEIAIAGKTIFNVVMEDNNVSLEDVVVVAYANQKKATLTGAVSSITNEALLRSPNASVANTLAGQISGLSTVQKSGQPGKEDPSIFVRGVGSLTEGGSTPLILVDGVERSFTQMDPNEIESVSVLKDASATAVFGVRGANGVIIVTTKRGSKGKAKISLSTSYGINQPTRILKNADSYTYATVMNEQNKNDLMPKPVFSDYALERFRLGDDPIMYPNVDWIKYTMKDFSAQSQHNLNISGGSDKVRYFISVGYLTQEGLLKQFETLSYNNNFNYDRFNYRSNLDIDVTKTTSLKIGIGGILGNVYEPAISGTNDIWLMNSISQPFSGPGIVDGKLVISDKSTFPGILLGNSLQTYYNRGFENTINNTMNLDFALKQDMGFVLKGLSAELKAAYNSTYGFTKSRISNVETYNPFYASTLSNPNLSPTDPTFDKSIVYLMTGKNSPLSYEEKSTKARDWYFEASLRYNKKFGDHTVSALVLYNQNKKYYPSQFPELPAAYVGLVGRVTYDFKSKYLAEFNAGYNGSENFAPGKRYGFFPAGSLGYIVTEEKFMKEQRVIDYLKLRASVGLVGNDNMNGNRYLYLPDAYKVDLLNYKNSGGNLVGYNFGTNSTTVMPGAQAQRLGNPDVTWETALKQNVGIDIMFFKNRLKITTDYFTEQRKNILINRGTIPVITNLGGGLLPVVNLGIVDNAGYEFEATWNQTINKFNYWITGNMSYSKNTIVFMDEVEPNYKYQARTGRSVGEQFGYVASGFYKSSDFNTDGTLVNGMANPGMTVHPGDVKYSDLNNDGVINADDQTHIGNPARPAYVLGLNYGVRYKGFVFTMNWTGAAERSVLMTTDFVQPFRGEARGLFQYQADNRWTPETAETATMPRVSTNMGGYNYRPSSLWIRDGSYIRLKNASVGYSFFNKPFLKQLGVSELGIQLTGYNMLTFDKMKFIDPEGNPNNSNTYPIVKQYNLSINVNF